MLRTLWKWLAATFSVAVILLAIGIGLFRLILPLVPQYHQRIESFASDAAGTPVSIEGIDARWGWDGPELRFRNAQLLTADGSVPLLSAKTGSVVLDLGVLLRERQFRAGQILLDGLRLEVLRDTSGGWQVGGRVLEAGSGVLPTRLAVGMRNAQVVFRDDINQVGPWVFDNVSLNVHLQDQHLDVDGLLKLPAELGGQLELSLQADGDLASPKTAKWQAYLNGSEMALSGWSGLLPKNKAVPVDGTGDVVAWFAMESDQLQQASLQFDLQQLALANNGETLRLYDAAKGQIEFDRIDAGWQLTGRDIIVVSEAITWPVTSFGVEQVGALNEDGLMYADIDYVRLQDVAPLVGWIEDEKIRGWLTKLEPRGTVEDISLRVTREQGKIDNYTMRSSFSGLGMTAVDDIPGFDGMRGNLRLDAFGGRLQLDPESVVLDLPEIVGKPVTTQRLNGVIVWRHNAGGWRVVSDNIDLDHAAFRSSTSLELTLPSDQSAPSLDLRVNLNNIDVAKSRNLIPVPILKPDLRRWLETALVGGTVPTATIQWSGAMDNFPFDDGVGEFWVDAEFRDGELAYAKNWPTARGLNGTLSFRNASIMAGVEAADLSGNRVSSASVAMEDFRKGILKLDASADGMLDSLHGFLKETPVVQGDDDPFAQIDLAGAGTTVVDLTLPLKAMQDSDVSVSVSSSNGQVSLHGLEHQLEQIEGSLTFRNGEFFGTGMTALVLGAPVVIDVVPGQVETIEGPRKTTIATARGQVSDQELDRLHTSLSSVLQGSTSYIATVTFPEKSAPMPVSVAVISRLEGMAVTLPQPMNKSAAAEKDFLLTVALPSGNALTDVFYGEVASARVNWQRNEDAPWQLDRGAIHLGVSLPKLPEEPGLVISGTARRLDVGGWLGINEASQSNQSAPITSARLDVEQMDVFGQELDDAILVIDRSEREWLVQIDSPTMAGALFVPFELGQQPVIANLERLYIDTGSDGGSDTGGGDAAAAGPTDNEDDLDPRKIPSMDIQADDFRLGAMKLGQLTGQIRSQPDGISLEKFNCEATSFKVSGLGAWRIEGTNHRSSLEMKLLSSDVKPTLADLDFDESVDASEAEIDFSLNWPGPPGPEFKRHLDGQVKVRVGAGQLQTVEPGAGRVFGLFSFAALPRRLSLDFRDVFDSGFGFDYIQGDFTVDDGDAFTSNLILEGPAAQVGIAGRVGLVARDYDQTAVVYGNFGAALPVAGVLAGGPVGGAAMLIFSELFKKSLQDMARANYRISGSWDEPAIERVLASASTEGES